MEQEFNQTPNQEPEQVVEPTTEPIVEPTQDDSGKNFSIAALVCGILGLCGGVIPVVQYFTLVLAVLGIVFGVIGMKKTKATSGKANGMAVAGMVLGIVGVGLTLVLLCVASCAALAAVGALAESLG